MSFILVLAAGVYQRLTGPTYPVRGRMMVANQEVRFQLPTSTDAAGGAEVRLAVPERSVQGFIEYRRTPSHDEWRRDELERDEGFLVARIPQQPPAGKVMYRILLGAGNDMVPLRPEPVVIRFKGKVPWYVLWPHVVAMFLAMLFSMRAGMEAFVRGPDIYRLSAWTVILLGIGGFILGPVMQKLAFASFWTGWPLGTDLTDNKTTAAALFWIIALWRLRKDQKARSWPIAASIVLFLVYLIPHSLLGSEIDYTQT